MSVIRCPKCRLVNREKIRRCRRCGTVLPGAAEIKAAEVRALSMHRAIRRWVVPVLGVITILCLYGFYRHRTGSYGPGDAVAATTKTMETIVRENRDLEFVRNLHSDFIAKLDQNMADREGRGYTLNQPLASETMKLLDQNRDKIKDPLAQKCLDEFYSLVEKYNAQLIQYNSDIINRGELKKQTNDEIERIQQDASMTPEERAAKTRDLNGKFFDTIQKEETVNNIDIVETAKSLRNLAI